MNSIIKRYFTDDRPNISPYCFHTFSPFPLGEFGFYQIILMTNRTEFVIKTVKRKNTEILKYCVDVVVLCPRFSLCCFP